MATTEYWYVDPDATGDGTGSSYTNAYTTLNAAEQAKDADITAATGSDKIIIFRCRSLNGTADATAVSVAGWTTASGNYVQIETESSEATGRHHGVWSATHYRVALSNTTIIGIAEEYVRIDGLQIQKTGSNGNTQAGINITGIGAGNDIRISNCIVRQAGNASYTEPGIRIDDADVTATIWNCIIYGLGTNASADNAAIMTNAGNANVYGCTAIGGYRGIRANTGTTINAKNCYAVGSNAAYGGTGTINQTTCASADTTAAGTSLDSIAYDTTEGAGHAGFTNVTAGSEDLHLKAGSALVGVGTTLTDDPPGSTALGVDIDGETRS